jgi:hypothetical protein
MVCPARGQVRCRHGRLLDGTAWFTRSCASPDGSGYRTQDSLSSWHGRWGLLRREEGHKHLGSILQSVCCRRWLTNAAQWLGQQITSVLRSVTSDLLHILLDIVTRSLPCPHGSERHRDHLVECLPHLNCECCVDVSLNKMLEL